MGEEVIFASASELAEAIRSRELSAVEVLEAHLARIDAQNPAVNAVVTLDAAGARKRAREADQALARGEVWGPLHGVPFTLKDAFATAGMRTTTGFPPLADHVPAEDSTMAARLKAAGGILMGKTNVPLLLGDAGQSSNPIFGRTNNPWNVERAVGGSSGGAAAAVAAGMTPFDVGTDLAGSIRIPAHFCGVFGFKTTEHRASLAGVVPGLDAPRMIRIMSSVGPIARTVEDLALLYRVIAGPDREDFDVPPVPLEAAADVALRGLRVAVAFLGLPVAAEIRAAVASLAERLANLGAIVEEPAIPNLDPAHMGELIGMIAGGEEPTLAQYMEALERRDRTIAAWERFFDDWDILLCPPSMTTAFPHCEPGTPLNVDGAAVDYWLVNAHTTVFNYIGAPAVVLPCTLDRDGLPIGIQLATRRWSDSRLLGIARAVSEAIGRRHSVSHRGRMGGGPGLRRSHPADTDPGSVCTHTISSPPGTVKMS